MSRLGHLKEFYGLLDSLEETLGGMRLLSDCSGRMLWPKRGVYFFTETGENRDQTGMGPRVVRVGTHALKRGARSTLWKRLRQHKGQRSGGGRHRTSIFRGVVGSALIERDRIVCPSWVLRRRLVSPEEEKIEEPVERAVSKVIGDMRLLWLAIEDEPGPDSERGYIERNAIALLSNYRGHPIDPPSSTWLGRYCLRGKVRPSGLWNSNHVGDSYDPAFLHTMADLIARMADHSVLGTSR